MRHYAYYSMLSLTGAYGFSYYDVLGDEVTFETNQITNPPAVEPKKRKILSLLLTLLTFKRF